MILHSLLLLLLAAGASHPAFAGPVTVQSIQIVPTETTVGRQPDIKGRIAATKTLARGETLKIVVIAVVNQPDHVVRSWSWKKVSMRAGEVRSFTVPKKINMTLAGTYKVDFNVYSKDMKPLHSLSKTFVAVDPSRPPKKTEKPEVSGPLTRVIPSGQEATYPVESRHFGVGLYADTLHSTGGATMLLWPFKYVGLQASYSVGSFTIAEGRLLARFPFSSGITPYLGAGYMKVTTERSVEIVGIKTRFQNSGASGVIGAEIPLSTSLFGYVEISGASIKLKKEVTNGSISGTASIKYAPVTIGIGVVYFLF